MSQYDFGTIVATTKSGTALAADLNAWRSAVHTMHKGPTAPTYAVAGMQWLDDTTTPIWLLKQYDGVAWSSLLVIDTTNDRTWPVGENLRYRYPLAGGTADALLLAPVPAPTTYAVNEVYTFEAGFNITGPATLNVSTLGVKAIRKIAVGVDIALEIGDIIDGGRYTVIYDPAANAAAGAFMLMNPSIAAMPVGSITSYAGRIAPTGWLFAAGQSVSRTTYSRLFGIIAPPVGTCTISIASPGVITLSAHGLVAWDRVSFETTGALPTGIVAGTNYFVSATGLTATTFQITTAYAGASVNTSGTQSGVQTARFTPYGCGNGTTTFTIPNYSGRVGAGRGNMSGTSVGLLTPTSGFIGDVLGWSGGTEAIALVESQIPSHTHPVSASATGRAYGATYGGAGAHTHLFGESVLGGSVGGSGVRSSGTNQDATSSNGAHEHTVYVDNDNVPVSGTATATGGGGLHANAQPSIIENVIIKF